jgi:predicted N-formylglutamate amidohydrolase
VAIDEGAANTEEATVEVINPSGQGRFVLVCEHASSFIPEQYDNLGLDSAARVSHIAWDPGALDVARAMAVSLDAPLVAQRVSRLVIDCNRPPQAPDAIPEKSEIYDVPGNVGLGPADRGERVEKYYAPFREALATCIGRRMTFGPPPTIVSIHSFTPVYDGIRRDLDLGVLHDSDTRFADALLEAMSLTDELGIRRNEPYGPEDGVMHTLVEHAVSRGLWNAMIEIRNDLIADKAARDSMAARLTARLTEALDALSKEGPTLEPAARGGRHA